MSNEALELKEIMEYDPRFETIATGDLVCIGHCPEISYFTWLFEYKDIYILMTDQGNGYYAFDREIDDISNLVIDYDVAGYGKRHYPEAYELL